MFILPKLHICKFEKKSEKLFWAGGHYKSLRYLTATTTRFARGCQGRGVAVRCTRLRHSFASGFSRFASGFSTERARLVVQVKELCYAASRLTGALRFARGFKKAPITHKEFEPKFQLFWNLKLDFFPVKKSFSRIFQNTANFFHLNFISKKKPKKSENLFSRSRLPIRNLNQNSNFFETWSWIFFR